MRGASTDQPKTVTKQTFNNSKESYELEKSCKKTKTKIKKQGDLPSFLIHFRKMKRIRTSRVMKQKADEEKPVIHANSLSQPSGCILLKCLERFHLESQIQLTLPKHRTEGGKNVVLLLFDVWRQLDNANAISPFCSQSPHTFFCVYDRSTFLFCPGSDSGNRWNFAASFPLVLSHRDSVLSSIKAIKQTVMTLSAWSACFDGCRCRWSDTKLHSIICIVSANNCTVSHASLLPLTTHLTLLLSLL